MRVVVKNKHVRKKPNTLKNAKKIAVRSHLTLKRKRKAVVATTIALVRQTSLS
jgi:hypothetical protein